MLPNKLLWQNSRHFPLWPGEWPSQ